MNLEKLCRMVKSPSFWAACLLLAGFGWVAWLHLKPNVSGFLYDDGIYMMLGKALASGQGYRLIDLAGEPTFYKYPPLYPAILALGWKLFPHFPENIPFLKAINIGFSLITLGLWGYYFGKIQKLPTWITLSLLAIIASNSRIIEYATETLSEPLYMALTTAVICLCAAFTHKQQRLTATQTLYILVLSIAAFYTRTMGLTLIIAISIWLWLCQSKKLATLYGMGSMMLMLPWFWWSGSRRDSTYAIGDFLIRTFQETYFQSLKMDLTYEYTPFQLVSKGWDALVGYFSIQCFPLLEKLIISKPSLGVELLLLALSLSILIPLVLRGFQCLRTNTISPEGIYLTLYLCILPCWSFYNYYPRFIVPLLPLLWFFLVRVIQQSRFSSKTIQVCLASLLTVAISSNCIQAWPYVNAPYPNTLVLNLPLDLWQDYEATYEFFKTQTPKDSIIYAENTDDVYMNALHSQRKSLDFIILIPPALMQKRCPEMTKDCLLNIHKKRAQASLRYLSKYQVNYIIAQQLQVVKGQYNASTVAIKSLPIIPILLKEAPDAFKPVFTSPHGLMQVYAVQPSLISTSSKIQ